MKLKTVLINICKFAILVVIIYKTHQAINEVPRHPDPFRDMYLCAGLSNMPTEYGHIFIDPPMPLGYKTKRDLPLHLLSVVPLETLTLSSVCNANMKRAGLEQTTMVDSADDTE
jgi:hypothetical protein